MSIPVRLAAASLTLLLAACGTAGSGRLDYKGAKNLPTLEVPPTLSEPVNTGTTELPGQEGMNAAGGAVLPATPGVQLMNDGNMQWLHLEASPEQLWTRLREFWPTLGLVLKQDNPAIGVMETDWAENRADVAHDFITDTVRKVFANAYSADTRDRYRLRLERSDGGGSEIYITHYGLKQVIAEKHESIVNTVWVVRPSDPELAYEVMKRLALYLGGEKAVPSPETAQSGAKTERAWFDGGSLLVDEGFARAWRRVGIALDRLGLVVEDRNRSRGIYYLSEVELGDEGQEKQGWFASLFSSEEKKVLPSFQLQVSGDDVRSRLTLMTKEGETARGEVATELLKRLQNELK